MFYPKNECERRVWNPCCWFHNNDIAFFCFLLESPFQRRQRQLVRSRIHATAYWQKFTGNRSTVRARTRTHISSRTRIQSSFLFARAHAFYDERGSGAYTAGRVRSTNVSENTTKRVITMTYESADRRGINDVDDAASYCYTVTVRSRHRVVTTPFSEERGAKRGSRGEENGRTVRMTFGETRAARVRGGASRVSFSPFGATRRTRLTA